MGAVDRVRRVCIRLEEKLGLIRTEALHDHVHRDGQVDELGGLAERLGDGRDGREVDIRRERTERRIRRSESGNVLRRNFQGALPEHGGKRGHREDEPFFSGGIDAIWLRRTLS